MALDDEGGVTARLHDLRIWDPRDLWTDTESLYPALVVPVEGKYHYLCPDDHVDAAREIISRSENFLIIGSSGLDDDLIDLLRQSGNTAFTLCVVSRSDATDVLERFQQIPIFAQPPTKTRIGDRGFSQFIANGDLTEFMGILYDDENRDGWLSAADQTPDRSVVGGQRT